MQFIPDTGDAIQLQVIGEANMRDVVRTIASYTHSIYAWPKTYTDHAIDAAWALAIVCQTGKECRLPFGNGKITP